MVDEASALAGPLQLSGVAIHAFCSAWMFSAEQTGPAAAWGLQEVDDLGSGGDVTTRGDTECRGGAADLEVEGRAAAIGQHISVNRFPFRQYDSLTERRVAEAIGNRKAEARASDNERLIALPRRDISLCGSPTVSTDSTVAFSLILRVAG